MSKFKLSRKINWNLIISVCCAMFALIAIFQTDKSNRELAKTNRRLTSVEYKPILRISNPQILGVFATTDNNPYMQNNDPSDTIGSLSIQIELRLKFKVSNVGNNTASITGWIIRDIQSTGDDLRKLLITKQKISTFIDSSSVFPHRLIELAPFDSTWIELTMSPEKIQNNCFTLHLLLLYQNDFNQLYDIYNWTEFETSSNGIFNPKFELLKPGKWRVISKDSLKIVTVKSTNNYSKVYSKEEQNYIFKHFQKK
jgi:hypothetical protein